MRATRLTAVISLAFAALAAPATAQQMGYRGWGPRVGVASDPDQVVAGLHFDVGEFAPHVHFVPNFELGFGDDHTIIAVTAPALYRWDNLKGNVRPFAGGGVTVGWIDHDHPDTPGDENDTDVEVAAEGMGGVVWKLRANTDFSVEMNVLFGDLWDVQFLAGWTFRP